MKKQNGITLVALVITIIVLLILAGVTIQSLIGDIGLLVKANEAKNANENANIEEQIKLAYQEYQAAKFTNPNLTVESSMKASLEKVFDDIINIEQVGKSIKVTFTNENKNYKYYSNGTVKEIMNPTSVYAKLNGDTLKLRATNPGNYNLYTTSKSIELYLNESKDSVKYIEIEEPIAPTSINFSELSNLISISNIEYLHTENMKSFASMFAGCTSLIELDLSSFDTSSITNMSYMFQFNSSLTNINLNNFDTSSVTSMLQLFFTCKELKELDISSFDTSNVTNMSTMFCQCAKLKKLNLGKNFVMDNVTSSNGMFQYANGNIKIKAIESTAKRIKEIDNRYTDRNFE